MKLLIQYLVKEKGGQVLLFLLFSFNYFLIVFLYNIQIDVFWYTQILAFVIFMGYLSVGYVQFYRKYKIIEKSLKEEYLFEFKTVGRQGILEKKYSELINRLINEKNNLISAQNVQISDMTDYYTMWAHQIKTPISALNLMIQVIDEDSGTKFNSKELKQELFKIEFYTESVLQYLRVESTNSDFRFDLYNLDIILKRCVKKFAPQFIYKKIKLQLESIDAEVLTDKKWISFVIEQLLSNAVKYTEKGGQVHIYKKNVNDAENTVLVIEDNGIGISAEDLPRVFERGFTGYNGRMESKSTGIGLYLCKKTLDRLNHKIWIQSKDGIGTSVFIEFKKKDIKYE